MKKTKVEPIGKRILVKVVPKKEKDDEYGYPINKYDSNGEPIIKEIKMYHLPYLKDEVRSPIMWIKDNPLC